VTAMDGKCCCCWSCSSISLISQHITLLLYHSRLCFEASRKDSLRFRWLNKPTPFVVVLHFWRLQNWIFSDPPYTQRPASCTKRSMSLRVLII
jgi:hypothetical protein